MFLSQISAIQSESSSRGHHNAAKYTVGQHWCELINFGSLSPLVAQEWDKMLITQSDNIANSLRTNPSVQHLANNNLKCILLNWFLAQLSIALNFNEVLLAGVWVGVWRCGSLGCVGLEWGGVGWGRVGRGWMCVEDTFTTSEIQIWLPGFILGINPSMIHSAWTIWAKVTRYLGNDTEGSSLSVDGQLNIRINAWTNFGIHSNKAIAN